MSRISIRPALTAAAIGIAFWTVLSGSASATPGTGAPSTTELASARHAAIAPENTARLASFFVQLDARAAGKPVSLAAAKPAEALAAKKPEITGSAVAVYSLNPAFVAGTSSSVARFTYATVEARSATGQRASVWIARSKVAGGWEAVNVSSTADEVTYPRQAGPDLIFTEPQINAWYRVRENKVVPLNDAARTEIGQHPVTLHRYQDVVRAQYGDKLPGSAYAKEGKLGGYGQASAAAEAWPVRDSLLAATGLLTASSVIVVVIRRRRRARLA